jgi:hypothetical protein
VQLLIPVMPATWETESGKTSVQVQLWEKVNENFIPISWM